MATTPVAPPTSTSTLDLLLGTLSVLLNSLATIPVIGQDAALAGVFLNLFQKVTQAIHAQAGQPIDLTKLPMQTPVA